MPILATIIGFAAVVWTAVYARRGSLLLGCGACVAVGYVFGYEYWNSDFGPLPLTLDRILLLGVLFAAAIQWRSARLAIRPLTGSDWALAALILVLVASALTSGGPEPMPGITSKWGRLLASFLLPAALYLLARNCTVTPRDTTLLLAGMVALGTYLGVTALLEVTASWSFVFPRHIADPGLGIHFGRARGPELNAASLGIYLTACIWCGWILLGRSRRWQQLAIFVLLPVMALGVFFTYTRSTWLGLATSGLVVAAVQIPKRWRLPAISAVSFAGLIVIALSWSHVVGLQREGTAAEAEHSVDQRTSFAYVSWQMFRDHPVRGVGFGRFFDRKLPYLSDRSQSFELESIRPLHHHNTLLSLLTETGMIGFAAFAAVLIAWSLNAWRLALAPGATAWARSHGVLMLAIATSYLCSALFHDLTLVPSQHWLLFLFAGVTISVRQDSLRCAMAKPAESGDRVKARGEIAERDPPLEPNGQSIPLFGMQISNVTMQQAVNEVLAWCDRPRGTACRYVVTPNVDHAVLFQEVAALRAAYSEASLVLADGAPIVMASRLFGRRLPERVAGSDMVPRLFQSTSRPLRVFLLGAAPGVAATAATNIQLAWPNVKIVGTYSPRLGFEDDAAENARILSAIAVAKPDVLVVGLGAPKQELWVHRHRCELQAKVALCAGATIDFLAGNRSRSPRWMRHAGLEWLHRVWCEPRRLARRYARDALLFPGLLWREWRRAAS